MLPFLMTPTNKQQHQCAIFMVTRTAGAFLLLLLLQCQVADSFDLGELSALSSLMGGGGDQSVDIPQGWLQKCQSDSAWCTGFVTKLGLAFASARGIKLRGTTPAPLPTKEMKELRKVCKGMNETMCAALVKIAEMQKAQQAAAKKKDAKRSLSLGDSEQGHFPLVAVVAGILVFALIMVGVAVYFVCWRKAEPNTGAGAVTGSHRSLRSRKSSQKSGAKRAGSQQTHKKSSVLNKLKSAKRSSSAVKSVQSKQASKKSNKQRGSTSGKK